jgi:signal transduction histidine kinase
MMENKKEHVVLIESDPKISDVIAQQTLKPLGYQVDVFDSASLIIRDIHKISPDIIITNLHLPGISGKDILVALNSQGIEIPVIVITPKGHESDALQAIRLGAANFLTLPIREAEVVNVVEDALNQHRKRMEMDIFSQPMGQSIEEKQTILHDYSEILSIGKNIFSSSNEESLDQKLVSIAATQTNADESWLLIFNQDKGMFLLHACLNADSELHSMLNLPYENSLSSLVAASGQIISMDGEALKRFNLVGNAESILVVPIMQEQEVMGMIAVERKSKQPFTDHQKAMLGVIAEYAAILMQNSSYIQKLEKHLLHIQQSDIYHRIEADLKNDLVFQLGKEMRIYLNNLSDNLDILLNPSSKRNKPKHPDALKSIQVDADILKEIIDSLIDAQYPEKNKTLEKVDLNDLVRTTLNRYKRIAQENQTSIKSELPSQPTILTIYSSQIVRVIEGIISNAIKYNPQKAGVFIRVEDMSDSALLMVKNQGEGISENIARNLFNKKNGVVTVESRRFGGIGISLPMMKEIISAHQGKIWIESGYGQGFSIFVSLPHKKSSID